jgi:hypothetical protein
VTPPADVTAEATGPFGAAVSYGSASAIDLVDGSLPASCAPASGSAFALGTTTVTCSATDAAGNTGWSNFTVTVADTTAPVVSPPPDVTAEATGPSGAAVSYGSASAIDLVDGSLPATCLPASGSFFFLGTTTVNCSATDAAGNTGSATFRVTVQDTTPPVVTVPADFSVEAEGASGAPVDFAGDVSASDLVDGSVSASCLPASGSTFALGSTTVICSATDAAGNTGSASFTVTVEDTTPPIVVAPPDMTAEATGPFVAVVSYGSATAFDLVDGSLSPICLPLSGGIFALGPTTVTCSATDAAGNTGSASFTVTVVDTTAPVVTPPPDVTAEATGPSGAAVSYGSASAIDLVDGSLPASCLPASGSTFALGTTTVICSATDAAGNTGSASFQVTVEDTTAPTVTVPANINATTIDPAGKVIVFSASASDLVDGSLTPACIPASGSVFPVGTTTVSCSATDAAGNTGSASFTVTIVLYQITFRPPINGGGVYNIVKLNRVVPVKFDLFVDGIQNLGTGVVTIKTGVNSCTVGFPSDEVEMYSAGSGQPDGQARWDSAGGFWIFNASTSPYKPATCVRGNIYLDGIFAGFFMLQTTR